MSDFESDRYFELDQYELGVTRAELMRIREDDAQRLRESWAAADARQQQRRLASRNAPKRRPMPQQHCRSAGVPTSVFFSPAARDIDRAKNVCAGCPAREPCLEGAKRRREKHGVWGGQVFPMGNRRPSPAPGRLRVVAGPVPSVGTVPAEATEDDHRKAS